MARSLRGRVLVLQVLTPRFIVGSHYLNVVNTQWSLQKNYSCVRTTHVYPSTNCSSNKPLGSQMGSHCQTTTCRVGTLHAECRVLCSSCSRSLRRGQYLGSHVPTHHNTHRQISNRSSGQLPVWR